MESTQALEKIIEEYEALRAENVRKREIAVQEVYAKVPEIKEIDDKMYSLGQNTLREILANPDKTGLKEELHKKYEVLKQTRKEILVKNSIPLDFDKVKHRCEKCQDTGFVEGEGRCVCFNQRVIDCMYEQSNMQELFKTQNFDLFRMDYYSEKESDKYKKSPRKQMEEVKSFCEKYADNFNDAKKSLCFYGDTGLGKTFMSSCIAKRLIDNGFTVLYIRSSKLFRLLEDEKFGRNEESVKELYDCDMLVIDDLGTEPEGKNNSAYLLELINERIMNNKKVIINTNLNFTGMEKKYTKRFSSRLIESFNLLVFFGDDIRRKVK